MIDNRIPPAATVNGFMAKHCHRNGYLVVRQGQIMREIELSEDAILSQQLMDGVRQHFDHYDRADEWRVIYADPRLNGATYLAFDQAANCYVLPRDTRQKISRDLHLSCIFNDWDVPDFARSGVVTYSRLIARVTPIHKDDRDRTAQCTDEVGQWTTQLVIEYTNTAVKPTEVEARCWFNTRSEAMDFVKGALKPQYPGLVVEEGMLRLGRHTTGPTVIPACEVIT